MEGPPFDFGELEEGRAGNYWRLNPALQAEAARTYPPDEFAWAEPVLDAFGDVVGHAIADNADLLDVHAPELQTYDKHGELLNAVHYHPAQFESERLVYESGIVADAFRAPPGRDEPVGLLHTLTMQLLLSYADIGLVCAQSMTSGAALVLRNHDPEGHLDAYLEGLTARDYGAVIEGAMFLTEEQGGSDVGANETVAVPVGATTEAAAEGAASATADGGQLVDPATDVEGAAEPDADALASRTYELTGEKWFCSNIDAQAMLALARRPDAPEGTKGLSLFLVPHRLPSGELNHQRYRRLKDKLGTKSVPTGEVEFDGTTAYLVGEPERGFKYMTTMLNWERVTNSVGALGVIGRLLLESTVHAANRRAFGHPIDEFPLMRRDLVELTVAHEAGLALAMEAARWFDRYERDHDDDRAYRLMRLLVPVSKHVTTRLAVDIASYAMEIQGGNGYVNDFVTHRLYRDVQALPIWEGTANILSLDVLRAMATTAAHEALAPLVEGFLAEVEHPALAASAATVADALADLQAAIGRVAAADDDVAQHEAKALAEFVADVVTASLLLSEAQAELDARDDARKALVARLFVCDALAPDRGRTIADGDAPALEHFDAIVRHERLDPVALGAD